MKSIGVHFMGRFGNQLFQYAHARAYAEQNGYQLKTDRWIGQKIFQIDDPVIGGELEMLGTDYRQHQKDAIYSRSDVRRWFKFRPEVEKDLSVLKPDDVLAHRRVGDYPGSGFPVVSAQSYRDAVKKFGYPEAKLSWITEEYPTRLSAFTNEFSFLPDFYRLMRASVLFRGNSTFSWWAATLGDGLVYAPIVKGIGLVGGKECDVEFVEGNHPACSDFDFVTDIHLKP